MLVALSQNQDVADPLSHLKSSGIDSTNPGPITDTVDATLVKTGGEASPQDTISLSTEAKAALKALPQQLKHDALVIDSKASSDDAKLAAYADASLFFIQAVSDSPNPDSNVVNAMSNYANAISESSFGKETQKISDMTGEYTVAESRLKGPAATTPSFVSELSLGSGMSQLDQEILNVQSVLAAASSSISSGGGSVSETKASLQTSINGTTATSQTLSLQVDGVFGKFSLALENSVPTFRSTENQNSRIGLALLQFGAATSSNATDLQQRARATVNA